MSNPVPQLVVSRPFAAAPDEVTPDQQRLMRRPIVAGGIVVLVFVVGFLIYASVFSLAGGVPAPGTINVVNNRKSVQHLDGGVIREIRVREGERVAKGQVLFVMDNTQPQAQVEVLTNEYDNLIAQKARLDSELADRATVLFPPELTARRGDPRIAALMHSQEVLFAASRGVYVSQSGVLGQRAQQLESKVKGLQAQVASVNAQNRLVQDEFDGVNSLYQRGYAPKSRVLALQRSQASLQGEKGAREADIASTAQAVGETRIQLAQVRQQRATQAADILRQVEGELTDLVPKLRAAQAVLTRTVVRAPVGGQVLGLTQFTEGGVARPGERLLDVVPENTPLIIRVSIRPDHIDEVKVGMMAEVHLTAFSARKTPPVKAKVVSVSADRITNDKGDSFFTADLVVDPGELQRLPDVKLTPGMPAQAIIVTGERTIMDYLTSPFTSTLSNAMREN